MPVRRHHLDGQLRGGLAGEPEVPARPLGDLVADADDRVQRGHRLLEDHRDLRAHERPTGGGRHPAEVLAAVLDRAGEHLDALGQQPGDRAEGQRLAGAGLPDDAEALAGSIAKDRSSTMRTSSRPGGGCRS